MRNSAGTLTPKSGTGEFRMKTRKLQREIVTKAKIYVVGGVMLEKKNDLEIKIRFVKCS